MQGKSNRTLRALAVFLPVLTVALLLLSWWPQPREAVYSLYRDRGKVQTLAQLQGYHRKSSEHFDVFYTDDDANMVDLVLETAEEAFDPVVQYVGYTPDGRVPVILYPDRPTLRRAFGWGSGESALGVYWKGTIRLLSPNVWIDETSERAQRRAFRKLNPIAHELTHYVLDYLTDGNYPRWFTEGLAQRVEYQISGYLWIEPESSLRQPLFTFTELDKQFDKLSNQPLAYRQVYLLVDYMAKQQGEDGLERLVQSLGRGVAFNTAVESIYGSSASDLFYGWEQWVQANLDQLEPADS